MRLPLPLSGRSPAKSQLKALIVVQPGSLGCKMTGDLGIKPVLNLGSQMKDFEGHGSIPVYFPNPANAVSGIASVNFLVQRYRRYSGSR
jgi:hypothetical protein